MPLSVGAKLGPYEILELIGVGGMGEVYRAHDSRLRRDVAIKVSAERFSERFEKEARAIASLNHANVCTLHDVGPNYLVMEFVEGHTLAERIKKGPVPLEEALAIAKQIADALESAHEKGITHRDLKPANINIKPDGTVKVLDFGLAKMGGAPSAHSDNSPTLTVGPTQAGMILGTAAYMSPEQARGKQVDRRTDIWAFGVVVYEMLTGKSLFKGEDISETLASVIKQDPDLSAVPAEMQRVLQHCLAKDPNKRLRDIGDWRLLLDGTTSRPVRRHGGAWLWPLVAATATLGLAAISFLHFREKPLPPAASLRFQIPPPEGATLGALLNVSPDGRKLAFLAQGKLWVHFLESGESRALTEATGTPFWSPDSRFIGYSVPGKLKKIEATGGVPQTVTDYRGLWGAATWNQDDLIVFSNRRALFRVPAAGGIPVQVAEVDPARQDTIAYAPCFLSDGQHFVYTRRSRDERRSSIYLGSVDAKPEQQSSRPLVNSFWGPQYAPSQDPGTGHLLFISGETLMTQPFDNRRLELMGQAAPIAEQIGDGRAFSSSKTGVLVFHRSASPDLQLTWYDREGNVLGVVGDSGYYRSVSLSPDGSRAVSSRNLEGQASNLWVTDLLRGTSARFAPGSTSDLNPIWSPDGNRILFSSNPERPFNLYQKPADGVKDTEVLLSSGEDKLPTSWSRDGRFLLYTVIHPKTLNDIWVLPLEGDRKPAPFLVTEFNEQAARFSPDGNWVAYVSDESGQAEVYVRSFSMGSGGKWLISNGGGSAPRWRGDGRELYYAAPGGRLQAVDIVTSPVFRPGTPQPLGLTTVEAWDASPDGKRFLVAAPKPGKPEPFTVVLNWQAGLKK